MDLDTEYRRKVALGVILIVCAMFTAVYLMLKFCRCCAHVGENQRSKGFFYDLEAIFFDPDKVDDGHKNKDGCEGKERDSRDKRDESYVMSMKVASEPSPKAPKGSVRKGAGSVRK